MPEPIKLTIEGEPIPKARPRMVNGRIWTPSNEAENAVAMVLRSSGYAGRFKGCKSLAVAFGFHGGSKLADIDNLVKFALDALVKSEIIPDDRYVTALYAERFLDSPAKPRTTFYVAAR